MFKTPVVPPLETIYEESGSFVSSTFDTFPQRSNFQSPISPLSQTINGLISARSIPTVDIQRQRANESQYKKLPIEVRFRDGSKQFIHPSQLFNTKVALPLTTTTTNNTVPNRRNPFPSSSSSSSASSAPSDGHQYHSYPTESSRNEPVAKAKVVLTIITANDLDQAGITPSIASSADDSERSFLAQSLSTSSIETCPTTQETSETPVVKIGFDIHPSPRLPVKNSLPAAPERLVVKPPAPVKSTSNPLLSNSGSRSAFRPVLKSIQLQSNLESHQTQVSNTTINGRSYQTARPSIFTYQPLNITKPPGKQFNHHNATLPPKPVPLPPPSLSIKTSVTTDHLLPNTSKTQTSLPNEPSLKWYQVTSKSIYDVPHLSNQYAHVPLHINIPPRTPNHYQKLLIKHDTALEKRLLNAGLSPETVALYERLLHVADPTSQSSNLASLKTPVHVQYSLRS